MLAILHPLLSNHIDERAEYFFNNVVNELDRPRHERLERVGDLVNSLDEARREIMGR